MWDNLLDAFNRLSPLLAIVIIFIAKSSFVTESEFNETREQIFSRLQSIERTVERMSGEKLSPKPNPPKPNPVRPKPNESLYPIYLK